MIPIPLQLLVAMSLDALIGDPTWWPHPVRFIGAFALILEQKMRALFGNELVAGAFTAFVVIGTTWGVTFCLLEIGSIFHPLLGDAISIFIMYTGIAAHDLAKHARSVHEALDGHDMELARKRVGMICGRDTDIMDGQAAVTATIESVAENSVDGVTAPLFYGLLGGPIGVMVYKAISTLDSTFGYKNERYLHFGWASARLDDVAAFVPSRLTSLLVPVAAWITGLRGHGSFMVLKRDRLKHASPNSGHTEAAFAGALGLRLGGPSYYGGVLHEKPFIGDPVNEPDPQFIEESVKLMNITTVISFIAFTILVFLLKTI